MCLTLAFQYNRYYGQIKIILIMEINLLKDKFFNALYDNVKDCVDPDFQDCCHNFGFVALVHLVGTSLRFDKVFRIQDANFVGIDEYISCHPEWQYYLVSFDTNVLLRGLLSFKDFHKDD